MGNVDFFSELVPLFLRGTSIPGNSQRCPRVCRGREPRWRWGCEGGLRPERVELGEQQRPAEHVSRLPCRIPSSLDNSLLHAIETIVIDWSHQIRDVLSKDSAQALLDGLHPLPRVEFEFWDARLINLKCIHEQVTPAGVLSTRPSPRGPGGPPESLSSSRQALLKG